MSTKILRVMAVAAITASTAASCSEDDGMERVTLGTTSWHDGFLWSDADTTSLVKRMALTFNDDAVNDGAAVDLVVTDNDGAPVPEDVLEVTIDGRRASGNVISISAADGGRTREVGVGFRFLPKAEGGKHQGYLVMRPHGMACVNGMEASEGAKLMQWTIYFDKDMNPLAKGQLITLCAMAAVIFLARLALHRRTFGPTARKSVVVTDQAGRIIYGPKTVRMGGFAEVVLTSRAAKQSLASAFFTGRTLCVTSPAFTSTLRMKPGRRGRKEIRVAGGGFTLSASKTQYSDAPLTATDNTTKNKIQLS